MIREINVTTEARQSGRFSAAVIQSAVEALRQDGIVILTELIDPNRLVDLRQRMLDDSSLIRKRVSPPFQFVEGHVRQNPPPSPPFLLPEVLLNSLVIQVTHAVLGKGVKNAYYSGNVNLPGSKEQPVHVDRGQLWANLDVAPPASHLVINVPLVDIDASNGVTEFWLGSHRETSRSLHQELCLPQEKLALRRASVPPVRPAIRCGSAIIRDMRLWHRGTPNRSSTARPMIAMIHCCEWIATDPITFQRGTEAFFEHPILTTHAQFTDAPIDYLDQSQAYYDPAHSPRQLS